MSGTKWFNHCLISIAPKPLNDNLKKGKYGIDYLILTDFDLASVSQDAVTACKYVYTSIGLPSTNITMRIHPYLADKRL